ncbi:MAG: N-acetylglucosamine-6-phosphate deacetylase [Actinobacteria bacterium ADurb.Bin346]|nr:MAG: N-acetylglucosamine-6-phosphate deacetylase [Actinobacteria bacterium ADurb.Bin346]
MEDLYIYNGKIITPFESLKGHAIHTRDGKILSIALKENKFPEKVNALDAGGGYIVPGFIDLHAHGGGGADSMDGSTDAVNIIASTHCRYGTTSFLAATMTMSKDDIFRSLVSLKEAHKKGTNGAQVIGIHLEGPFINEEMKGAQNKEHIIPPDIRLMRKFQEISGGFIKIVTLAPELPGSDELICWLCENNIVVSAGHTNATFEQIEAAVKLGLRHITHTFNAMTGLHHRKPGAAGAALTFKELTVELIADGIHVHPAVMRLIVNAKEKENVVLITDAIRAAGLPPGKYDLGGQEVSASRTKAILKDGTLAGSVLTMDRAVKNMIIKAGVSLENAMQMATYNPAKCIGIDNIKGSLASGKDADIVILNKNFETEITIVMGKAVFNRKAIKKE